MNTQINKKKSLLLRKRWMLAIALGAMAPLAGQLPHAQADTEFGDNTPYYEDDAWYDISEWFDGNDYNPTDEAIGRWDNETFEWTDNLTSSDNNNLFNAGEARYGFLKDKSSSTDDNWFYDYYDYGQWHYSDYNRDGTWDYSATYHDYDNDGVYDTVSEYFDTDGDGIYEDFNYISFSDINAEEDKQNKLKSQDAQKSTSSQVVSAQGVIKAVKEVKTPHSTNLVVVLSDTDEGSQMIADLGPAKKFDETPRKGQDIRVQGAKFKVGEKSVLVAQEVTHAGNKKSINRSGREFTGSVQDMMTAEVRGNTHQLVKIETDNDKKLLVDLGPKDKLEFDVKKGSELTVSGPAVKVKNRLMLIAQQITSGDKSAEVHRVALKQ